MSKTVKLRPEDLPMQLDFEGPEGLRKYVLIKTKQGKVLLNKLVEDQRAQNPIEQKTT